MGIPELCEPTASVAAGWTEGLGKGIENGGTAIFSDLSPPTHLCLQVDGGRCIASYDCPYAGAFIHSDCSQVCAGDGPEPARRHEEIGRVEESGHHRRAAAESPSDKTIVGIPQ